MIPTQRALARLTAALGATVVTLAATALAPSAGAATLLAPGPTDKVTIDLVSVNGSGCRPGSAAIAVAPDNTAFTVTYSEYLAQVGKGALPTDLRKNCQLALRVNVPQGFTYAVGKVDYRGFASLERGALGSQNAGYYFQGMSKTVSRNHKFRGPTKDNWQATDTVPLGSLQYKQCGEERNFNINTELRVDGGTSDTAATTSFMTMDSTDGSLNSTYHFAWKKCPRG